jgi:hypothetical protein
MGTYPDFGLRIIGFLRGYISVLVGKAPGNTSHGEGGRGCQDPSLAKLNYSVLAARGQPIFYVQSQDCSGVSAFGYNSSPLPVRDSRFGGGASE